jgi:hypothetical protein
MSQADSAANPWSAVSIGFLAQSSVDLSPTFGLYSAAAIGLVVRSQDGGILLDAGQYQTLSLNLLVGIAYKVTLDNLTGTAGAGFYFGSTMLNASNNSLSSYDAGGPGAGIGVSVLYSPAFSNWGIGANVNAAYYFTIPGSSAPTMAPSGFVVFGGVGVVLYYQPGAGLPPAVSRFSSHR